MGLKHKSAGDCFDTVSKLVRNTKGTLGFVATFFESTEDQDLAEFNRQDLGDLLRLLHAQMDEANNALDEIGLHERLERERAGTS